MASAPGAETGLSGPSSSKTGKRRSSTGKSASGGPATGPDGRKVTPMMRQYMEAKAATPGAILLFRMGDFYELFYDDARIAARELDLTLTAREKGANPIPMAGVPHHAISGYIAKLVNKGFTVAICDQVEDPKQAKGLVKREVTRLITPGTISDLEALDPASKAYLASVVLDGRTYFMALLDLLAGEILCTRVSQGQLRDELQRMAVREVLVAPEAEGAVRAELGTGPGESVIPLRVARAEGSETDPAKVVKDKFGTKKVAGLEKGGGPQDLRAIAHLVQYAESTQRRTLPHLMAPQGYRIADFLVVDEATRRNLELRNTTIDGGRNGSLLWHLDKCRTAMGSRTLAQWMLFPLRDAEAIGTRLDAVEGFRADRVLREDLQRALDNVRDIERLVGRVAVGRATPRDMGALRTSLEVMPQLQGTLESAAKALGELSTRWKDVDLATDVHGLLAKALVDDPPTLPNQGGIFAKGFKDDLDELIVLSTEGHDYLSALEKRERERTGIGSLKVRYNKVFGYYIEVTRAHLQSVPDDYVRKQTLVNAERFITDELKGYEAKVLTADERRKARESELFEELSKDIAQQTPRLRGLSRLVAETDVLMSLGQVADAFRYTRPILSEDSVLTITKGRHPVVERLMPGGEPFVANDLTVGGASAPMLLVTGPNMAGKSTALRQTALIALLAHMGSFVPAERAEVGLCDRIFTRVGASDDLGRGRSTFMVEMAETAAILEHAGPKSLVILDEIGRGTSTFDGVSIAWAVAEHIFDELHCRTLFATHYHELTDLSVEREGIKNISMAVAEENEDIVFLRRLVDGAANRSYGIHVAQLAGLPEGVIRRSREILRNLEEGELDGRGMPSIAYSQQKEPAGSQLNLFATRPKASPVESELAKLDPLNMTPMEALSTLEKLKGLLE